MGLYEVIQSIADEGGRITLSKPMRDHLQGRNGGIQARVSTTGGDGSILTHTRVFPFLQRARHPSQFLVNQLTHMWQDIQTTLDGETP